MSKQEWVLMGSPVSFYYEDSDLHLVFRKPVKPLGIDDIVALYRIVADLISKNLMKPETRIITKKAA